MSIAQPQFDVCGFVVGTRSGSRSADHADDGHLANRHPTGRDRTTQPASIADLQAGQSVVAYAALNLLVTNPVDATRLEIEPSVQIASIAPANPTSGTFDQKSSFAVQGSRPV